MVTLCSSSHSEIRHFKSVQHVHFGQLQLKFLVNIHTHIYHSGITHVYQNNCNLGKAFYIFVSEYGGGGGYNL